MDAEAYTARTLGDFGGLFEGIVNAVNRVILQGKEKATRKLRFGGPGIEQGGGGVGEPTLAEQFVGIQCRGNVLLVNANGHPHQHVLRSFDHFAVDFEQIRAFQGFESKIIVLKIPGIDDR